MPKDEFVSTDEAREILGYAQRSSVTRLVAAGELSPHHRGRGRTGGMFFRRSDVERIARKIGRAA